MAISLGGRLLGPSSGLPGSRSRTGPAHGTAGSNGVPRPVHCSLFDLAPGGVCLAKPVTRPAGELLPHRFTLTARAKCPRGGLLSVALSLASRPVGVTHHRVLRSPDFPPAGTGCGPIWRPIRSRPAAVRSTANSIVTILTKCMVEKGCKYGSSLLADFREFLGGILTNRMNSIKTKTRGS